MESKAKALGHPIHPMAITLPLGLLATALIFDLIHTLFDAENLARAAHYMIAAGVLSGLFAAVFGVVDWLAIPNGTRARQIGIYHAASNVVTLLLFTVAWFARDKPHDPGTLAILLEVLGAATAMVGGWFGGELIHRLGVSVTPGANLDAPSSLSDKPLS